MHRAVIVDAVRTPIGRFGGGLCTRTAAELAAHVIAALIARNGIEPETVDEVILGQVIQGGSGANIARTAALRAGLPSAVCGTTVNMVCGSGMKALELARQAIALGEGSIYIAGGAESMSNAPFYLNELRWGHRLGRVSLLDGLMDEALRCPVTGIPMGLTAEEIASRTGISRAESDAWALRSQERARAAVQGGRFRDEIVPVPREEGEPLTTDEHPQETSQEGLASLKPVFKEDGSVTAGNASGINDGAAAALLVEETCAEIRRWKARARIVASAMAGVEPEVMGLGPVPAVRALCQKIGATPADFQLVELNEAFAVQALAVIRELELDPERVNVNGSGIALGHPLGATGARIVVSLLYEMERRDVRLGLATLCIGGGMGMAMALERDAAGKSQ